VVLHAIERTVTAVRHKRRFKNADWLWDFTRPIYERILAFVGQRGLVRYMNGTDAIRVITGCRGVAEAYEPEFWAYLRGEVRAGDTVVDVGAHIGLYSIAFARWVGPTGRVIALEPDPGNHSTLQRNVHLNGLSQRIQIIAAAAGNRTGSIEFMPALSSESRIARPDDVTAKIIKVRCATLVELVANAPRPDVIKIDVEGYEAQVLEGAIPLLRDIERRPRLIAVELHAFAWRDESTLFSIQRMLTECGYRMENLDGSAVDRVDWLSQIVAIAAQ
jgi:FkbM family methyltransferase